MFLKDLFRYRTTDSKESREDFLSSCLAELMRRDAAACAAVLTTVGFSDLPTLTVGAYTVRTQVGRSHRAKMRWCDILVELRGGRHLLIECKVGDAPKLGQIKLYRKLWKTLDVALLAPEWSIPRTVAWDDMARGTWQDVWEAIAHLPEAAHGESFRGAFLDLLAHLGLEGSRNLSTVELTAAREAWHRQEPLRAAMREAVLALLEDGAVSVCEEESAPDGYGGATWGDARPLNCFWWRERPRDGLPLRGLGLEARLMEGVGAAGALDWILWVVPTTQGKASLKRAVKQDPTWIRDGEEWEHSLGDTGGPDTPFYEQLALAVKEARAWLRRGLGIPVGKQTLTQTGNLLTGKQAASDAEYAEGLESLLDAWGTRLSARIQSDLARRVKKSVGARLINDTARVIHKNRQPLWFGWEWAIDADPAWFDLLVGWQTKEERRSADDALASWVPPDGVQREEYDDYGVRYRVSLQDRDLASAIQLLAETACSLLDHDEQIVLRQLKVTP